MLLRTTENLTVAYMRITCGQDPNPRMAFALLVINDPIRCEFCTWLIWWFPWQQLSCLNTLRPRENGRHFADDIFKCIFMNENLWITIKISLKFVPKGPINYIAALVHIMAWRRPGDQPLFEPMMVRLPTHICVIRPHWVNGNLQV